MTQIVLCYIVCMRECVLYYKECRYVCSIHTSVDSCNKTALNRPNFKVSYVRYSLRWPVFAKKPN